MRKLIGLLLAVGFIFVFSAPAPAAEKTVEERVKALEDTIGAWNFYGSLRFGTFYEQSDKDAFNDTDGMTDLSGPDEKTMQWTQVYNSRIGAKVNKGAFTGRFEFGVKDVNYNSQDEEKPSVVTRLMFGTYTVNDATFLFGQDYAPLGDWGNSNNVFNGDNDMGGWGIIDEARVPQIKMAYKGLQVALVKNKSSNGVDTCGLTADDAKTEVVLPHLEMKYSLVTEKYFGDIFGGFNTYKVKAESLDIDKTVNSYALGVNGGVTLEKFYGNAMVWMARNGKQLGLHQADQAGAFIDPTGSLHNDDDLGWAVVAGTYIDKVTVEAGYGFVQSDLDVSGAEKDKAQNYYLQAVIPIAQGNGAKFSVTPEIGVIDYMDDIEGNDQGDAFYVGAKWQIDF
jgi:hypothetical protein